MKKRRQLVLICAFVVTAMLALGAAHADTQHFQFRFAVPDWSGVSLGSGDVDGDGVPDIIVPRGIDAQVISGATGQALFTLTPPDTDSSLSLFISSFAVGDLRGDGQSEVVVGAPLANCSNGRVYIFSSTTGAFQTSLDTPASRRCDSADGAFGSSVALLRSEQEPGSDIVVGAPAETVNGVQRAGRVYVFSGASRAVLRTLTAPSPEELALFGYTVRVAPAGRHSPMAIGEIHATVNGVSSAGRVYVFSTGATPDFSIDNPRPRARPSLP